MRFGGIVRRLDPSHSARPLAASQGESQMDTAKPAGPDENQRSSFRSFAVLLRNAPPVEDAKSQRVTIEQYVADVVLRTFLVCRRQAGSHRGQAMWPFVLQCTVAGDIPAGKAHGLTRQIVERAFERQKAKAELLRGNRQAVCAIAICRKSVNLRCTKAGEIRELPAENLERLDELKGGDEICRSRRQNQETGGRRQAGGPARLEAAQFQLIRSHDNEAAQGRFGGKKNGECLSIEKMRQRGEAIAVDEAERCHQRNDDEQQPFAVPLNCQRPIHQFQFPVYTSGSLGMGFGRVDRRGGNFLRGDGEGHNSADEWKAFLMNN